MAQPLIEGGVPMGHPGWKIQLPQTLPENYNLVDLHAAQWSPHPLFQCLQRVVLFVLPSSLVHDRWASPVTLPGLKQSCWNTLSFLQAPFPLLDRSWLETSLASWASAWQDLASGLWHGTDLRQVSSAACASSILFCLPGVRKKQTLSHPQIPFIYLIYVCHHSEFVSVACVHLTEGPSPDLPTLKGFSSVWTLWSHWWWVCKMHLSLLVF